jgi:hypothetical protein
MRAGEWTMLIMICLLMLDWLAAFVLWAIIAAKQVSLMWYLEAKRPARREYFRNSIGFYGIKFIRYVFNNYDCDDKIIRERKKKLRPLMRWHIVLIVIFTGVCVLIALLALVGKCFHRW